MLSETVDRLIETARDDALAGDEMNSAAQDFFETVSKGSVEEANDAIRRISDHFGIENMEKAAFLATICGALVEKGCDANAMAGPLLDRVESLLKSAVEIGQTCIDQMPEPNEEVDDDDYEDPEEIFDKIRQRVAPTMEAQNRAWEALEQFWRPTIAVFSRSAESRTNARHMRDAAIRICEYHQGGHWLQLILGVLDDDESILVIDPGKMQGLMGRFCGVVENFQLNVLLMDGFPNKGLLARRRVSQRVADIAKGIGPQVTEDIVTGVWNLYTWQAIQSGYKLPDPDKYGDIQEVMVWNEGIPSDIPVFEDRRVVLLGPPSYQRTWQSQRMVSQI